MSDSNPVERFREQYRIDAAAGGVRPLADYCRLFPGDDDGVAHEFHAASDVTTADQGQRKGSSTLGRRGPYELLEEVGFGGQGTVYRAFDHKLKRHVALKILHASAAGALSGNAFARFRREALIASRLDHQNLCSVYDFSLDGNEPYLVMRFIDGESLATRLKASGADAASRAASLAGPAGATKRYGDVGYVESMATIFEKVAGGLHALHEVGVLHRDVKPANIMLTRDGEPVLMDFGVARADDDEGPVLTRADAEVGTPEYMSPELLTKATRLDRRSDVWSLGVSLYEALTCRRPFAAATREAVYHGITSREPMRPRLLNPAMPRDLEIIVLTALEKDRDRRYAGAADFAADLRRFRMRQPIAARPVSTWVRHGRWIQRNPGWATAFYGIVVVLAVSVGVYRFQNVALDRANDGLVALNTALSFALSEYDRVADMKRLERARAEAELLWPIHPELPAKIEAWQARHATLLNSLAAHEQALARLRVAASPPDESARRREHPDEWAAIVALEERVYDLRRHAAATTVESERDRFEDAIEVTADESARAKSAFAALPIERHDFSGDVARQFRHDVLAQLVSGLRVFTAEETGVPASLDARRDLSKRIVKETLEDHADAWARTAERVAADPRFHGMTLRPQLGLIPLGPDPMSRFEEFLDWQTHAGPPARRDDSTGLSPSGDCGLIFVLLPGGRFLMGAQAVDPDAPHWDPDARPNESPVHEVVLDAFFLSKFEMTQGQWARSPTDRPRPSLYASGWHDAGVTDAVPDDRHPVEQVSWNEIRVVFDRLAIDFPTEEQWEYAARAGSDRIYGAVETAGELRLHANLAGTEAGIYYPSASPEHTDPFVIPAAVGSLLPNAFGLHDTLGNVFELCRDVAVYDLAATPDDGQSTIRTNLKSGRGGSCAFPVIYGRVADRGMMHRELGNGYIGVRPARHLVR